jgi:hypothetical protein
MRNYGSQKYENLMEYEEMINHSIPLVQKEYEERRAKLSQEQQKIVDKAIAQRYIILYDKTPKVADDLKRVCKKWCETNKTPMVFIGPFTKRTNKTDTHISFDPAWATPYEVHKSIYTPDLPDFKSKEQDEIFYLVMLLVVEGNWSTGHLHLNYVSVDNAEEVARQILAMYDRAYQKNLEDLKSQFPQLALV